MLRRTKISICCWIFGGILLVLGIIMVSIFPSVYRKLVKKNMVLGPKSKSLEYWQTIQLPVYHKLYFFNVTNPDEVSNGAKPILQEVGPYVYREHLIKENIVWNLNDTVTYDERHVYYYQQNMTDLHEDDVITTINAPLLTLAKTLQNYPMYERVIADILLSNFAKGETLFIKRSVRQLAFVGYHDVLVALSSIFLKNPPFKGNSFAWFVQQNNSNDGIYESKTGAKNMDEFLWNNKWRNKSKLPFWSGDKCNEIKGPIPELFPPQVYSDTLYMFVSDMCRSVGLKYDSTIKVHKMVESRRYIMPGSTLNPTAENQCFCNGPCYPRGVLNISACHGGAPVAMTLPHFYMADPDLLDDVVGLKPDKEKHQFYWDVEPITGMTSEFAARLQINIQLKDHFWLKQVRKVRMTLFPVLWIDKVGVMTDYLANKILDVTEKPVRIASIVCYCVIAFSLLIIITTSVVFVYLRRKQDAPDLKKLVDDDSDAET